MTVTMITSSSCFFFFLFFCRDQVRHTSQGVGSTPSPFKVTKNKKRGGRGGMSSREHKITKGSIKHHKPVLRISPRSLVEVQFSYMQGKETVPPCR